MASCCIYTSPACLVFLAELSLLFRQILGLVENMSCFKCPKCGEESYIFGEGGAKKTAEEMDMKLLGEVSESCQDWLEYAQTSSVMQTMLCAFVIIKYI